jgi:HSP20 family protein
MNVVKWNPFRELEEMQNRLNRVFNVPQGEKAEEPFLFADWAPAVDIQETNDEYLVKADLPDVKKEDIKIELVNGVLTIEGERKQEKEEKGKKLHRVERQYGQFLRRFTLPEEIDAAKIAAEFKDGVLNVTLPKSPNSKPKKIDIKVA